MKFFLSLCAVLAIAAPAAADNVITLNLETPELESSAPKPEAKTEGRSITVSGRPGRNQIIARVGVVQSERAGIHSKRSSRSRTFSTCLKDTPLAIVKTSGSWYGVMMIDGSTGWIATSKVKLLDYGIVANQGRSGNYPSRGGLDRTDGSGNAIVQAALQYLGVPYVYGGNSPSSGIDCSAFVKTVYSRFGVSLPRTAREQSTYGTPVATNDLQPGDRLYFACKHNYPDHCGIYMGNGYFVHASASRGGVVVDSLSSRSYWNWLVAVVR